jgi:creatinine amidohydrolase
MQKTFKYEEMIPDEFLAAVGNMPVFFVPTGLLEWHGDHLPLGQDTLKAYGICLETAKKLGGGIVLPPHYWGRPGFSSYVGTLTFSEDTMYRLFTELFEQLEKVGARVILVLTGHYGDCQVSFIKKVAKNYEKNHPKVCIIAQPEYEAIKINGETPADHAGKWETSMFWYLYPELARMENFKPGPYHVYAYENPPHNYYDVPPDGTWNEDLRKTASPDLGKKTIEVISTHLANIVKGKLESVT